MCIEQAFQAYNASMTQSNSGSFLNEQNAIYNSNLGLQYTDGKNIYTATVNGWVDQDGFVYNSAAANEVGLPGIFDFSWFLNTTPYAPFQVAQNNAYTKDVAKKLQQNCLDNFNNSGGGAVVNFFSFASPFIGPDPLNSAIEDVGGTGLKFAAYSFFKTASNTMVRTPFGSMSGLVSGTIETVATKVVVPVASVSTAVQVGVHLGCYLTFN